MDVDVSGAGQRPGSASATWRRRPKSVTVVVAVAAVLFLVLSGLGLYRYVTDPPTRIALRVTRVVASSESSGFVEVCFGSSSIDCYEVAASDAAQFRPVGGCLLVEFPGEASPSAIRRLDDNACPP